MDSINESWNAIFFEGEDEGKWEDEDLDFPLELELDNATGDGVELLHEAHEAINRLSQKTNKRGRMMRQPRRAESWQ